MPKPRTPNDLRSAYQLQAATLAWNVVGTAVLITAAGWARRH
ncbi:MAG: hypothetical protein ACXWZ3_09030 [Solirubrobacterales bacterium]